MALTLARANLPSPARAPPNPPPRPRTPRHTQNLPSIVVTHVLAPQRGERILDMCAAPGGKTTHIAARMGGEGVVVACDRSRSKVRKLRAKVRSMGLERIVSALTVDATRAVSARPLAAAAPRADGVPPFAPLRTTTTLRDVLAAAAPPPLAATAGADLKGAEGASSGAALTFAEQRLLKRKAKHARRQQSAATPKRGGAGDGAGGGGTRFPPECFDRVLLDGPCSALGLRPRLGLELMDGRGAEAAAAAADDPGDAARLAFATRRLEAFGRYQRQILWNAVHLLKPGGVLVYSTCTLSPLENEANVAHALATYPCLALVPATPRLPGVQRGLAGFGLGEAQRDMVQRYMPHVAAMDSNGFFIAKFVKSGSSVPSADAAAELQRNAVGGTSKV